MTYQTPPMVQTTRGAGVVHKSEPSARRTEVLLKHSTCDSQPSVERVSWKTNQGAEKCSQKTVIVGHTGIGSSPTAVQDVERSWMQVEQHEEETNGVNVGHTVPNVPLKTSPYTLTRQRRPTTTTTTTMVVKLEREKTETLLKYSTYDPQPSAERYPWKTRSRRRQGEQYSPTAGDGDCSPATKAIATTTENAFANSSSSPNAVQDFERSWMQFEQEKNGDLFNNLPDFFVPAAVPSKYLRVQQHQKAKGVNKKVSTALPTTVACKKPNGNFLRGECGNVSDSRYSRKLEYAVLESPPSTPPRSAVVESSPSVLSPVTPLKPNKLEEDFAGVARTAKNTEVPIPRTTSFASPRRPESSQMVFEDYRDPLADDLGPQMEARDEPSPPKALSWKKRKADTITEAKASTMTSQVPIAHTEVVVKNDSSGPIVADARDLTIFKIQKEINESSTEKPKNDVVTVVDLPSPPSPSANMMEFEAPIEVPVWTSVATKIANKRKAKKESSVLQKSSSAAKVLERKAAIAGAKPRRPPSPQNEDADLMAKSPVLAKITKAKTSEAPKMEPTSLESSPKVLNALVNDANIKLQRTPSIRNDASVEAAISPPTLNNQDNEDERKRIGESRQSTTRLIFTDENGILMKATTAEESVSTQVSLSTAVSLEPKEDVVVDIHSAETGSPLKLVEDINVEKQILTLRIPESNIKLTGWNEGPVEIELDTSLEDAFALAVAKKEAWEIVAREKVAQSGLAPGTRMSRPTIKKVLATLETPATNPKVVASPGILNENVILEKAIPEEESVSSQVSPSPADSFEPKEDAAVESLSAAEPNSSMTSAAVVVQKQILTLQIPESNIKLTGWKDGPVEIEVDDSLEDALALANVKKEAWEIVTRETIAQSGLAAGARMSRPTIKKSSSSLTTAAEEAEVVASSMNMSVPVFTEAQVETEIKEESWDTKQPHPPQEMTECTSIEVALDDSPDVSSSPLSSVVGDETTLSFKLERAPSVGGSFEAQLSQHLSDDSSSSSRSKMTWESDVAVDVGLPQSPANMIRLCLPIDGYSGPMYAKVLKDLVRNPNIHSLAVRRATAPEKRIRTEVELVALFSAMCSLPYLEVVELQDMTPCDLDWIPVEEMFTSNPCISSVRLWMMDGAFLEVQRSSQGKISAEC